MVLWMLISGECRRARTGSTWSFHRLFAHSGCHAQRVLSPVDGHAQLTHDLTHGFAGVPQTDSLTGELGGPHPVTAALDILYNNEQKTN